jgi:hypothetical protein
MEARLFTWKISTDFSRSVPPDLLAEAVITMSQLKQRWKTKTPLGGGVLQASYGSTMVLDERRRGPGIARCTFSRWSRRV